MFGAQIKTDRRGEDFIMERVNVDVQEQFRYKWSGFLFVVSTVVHANLVAHAKLVLKKENQSQTSLILNINNNPQILETTKSAASCQNDLCFTAWVATESTLMVLKFVQHVVHKLHTRNRSGGWGGGGGSTLPKSKMVHRHGTAARCEHGDCILNSRVFVAHREPKHANETLSIQ